MERSEVMSVALAGEDSRHQFKRIVTDADSLAAEMVAFLNSDGGTIYIGIEDKTGDFSPLDSEAVAKTNQLISNVATNNVKPAFDPVVENVQIGDGVVMCVTVPRGISKPYFTRNGSIWVKSGSDKRRVTAKEELLRMFQETGALHGDEMPVPNTSIDDFDLDYFKEVFEQLTGMSYEAQTVPIDRLLANMNLMRDNCLTVAGIVLFGRRNIRYKFSRATVNAARFPGTDVFGDSYITKQEFSGKLSDVYQDVLSFCVGNVDRLQREASFNSAGESEIPKAVFEEMITNALVHRDFFVPDSIKVFIFDDRVEIISPGHLPNSLTVENILMGNSCKRNSVLVSYATRLLQFSGYGSGIRRSLKLYPDIEFVDDRVANQFAVRIRRHGSHYDRR